MTIAMKTGYVWLCPVADGFLKQNHFVVGRCAQTFHVAHKEMKIDDDEDKGTKNESTYKWLKKRKKSVSSKQKRRSSTVGAKTKYKYVYTK